MNSMINRSLSKSKRKKGSMNKDTHSLSDIDGLIQEQLYIMQNGATLKEKKEARQKILKLERHKNDVNAKAIKKVYPKRPEPIPISKKDLLALIDSVSELDCVDGMMTEGGKENHKRYIKNQLDVSGVFISDDRTEEFPRTSILDGKFLVARNT